ncbi:TetR family transcriptional regulator [Nocardiopsis sp. CNT-189]|uniref:TetR/AcrR family transcriptional regulator n=1 Tax=Nocardiopsis oceanisediminis TaxID=2816862 RepID=UPI003B332872
MDAPAERHLPLRERKKLRTRRALAHAAQELFTRHGYDHVTLDRIAERAEVSRATFFRVYSSKEDVAIAAEKEFWAAYQQELADHPPRGHLLRALRDALPTTLDHMSDDWEARFLAGRRLAGTAPAVAAHSLQHCAERTRAILTDLAALPGLPPARDLHLRLCLQAMLDAWHCAVDDWAAAETPDRARLTAQITRAFDALPAALETTAAPPAD